MRLSEWVGNIASTELEFTKAIQVLRNYSLIEDVEDLASYATHPMVHRWAYHFLGEDSRVELAQLAVVTVGWSVPDNSTRDYSAMQRRLLLHAQACSRWVSMGEIAEKIRSHGKDEVDFNKTKEKETILDAIRQLGLLYADQGKLAEAEKMYQRALEGYEKAWGPEHTSTLDTVNNLGILYKNQGKMAEAEMSGIMPPAKTEEFVLGLARLFQKDVDIQATVRKAIERSKDELRFDQQRMVRNLTG